MEPKKIPNLNHNLLRGLNNFEFIIPNNKKISDKTRDHILIGSWSFKGQSDIIRKTKKNKKPKVLFDEIFMFLFWSIIKTYIKNC